MASWRISPSCGEAGDRPRAEQHKKLVEGEVLAGWASAAARMRRRMERQGRQGAGLKRDP